MFHVDLNYKALHATQAFLCDAVRLNRNSVIIDEESFQRLLCAAFTVQEYRDRKLSDISMQQPAGRAEPSNSVQCDPDLNLQGVCGSEDEGFDAGVLLKRLEQQFDLPTDAGSIGGSKAPVIGNKDRRTRPRFVVDLDTPLEHIPAITAGQVVQKDDLIAPHGPVLGERIALREPTVDVALGAADELQAVPNDLVREIVQQVLQATHATSAAFGRCLQGRLICEATAGDSASEIRAMINTGSGFTGLCAASGTMQSCGNTVFDSRADAEVCRRLGVRAVIVVPLAHEGQLIGLLAVFSRSPYAFGMRDVQALQDLTEVFTAKLQVRVESATANTGRESSVSCNSSPLHR
jgi:putative methionine-R-sulfoxide reductase with GAF domain